jgi:hypothetical protein
MSKQVIIPTAWILEMDDVGWDNGRDLRLIGQASRSGLPRHHAVEDYEFIRSLTSASSNHLATALCVADRDKYNILRGEVGIPHDPHGRDRADEMNPDYITVAYGTNDWSHRPYDDVKESCRAFYKKLSELYPNSKIFAITPIWRASHMRKTEFGAPTYKVDDMIREVCADLPNVTVITGWKFTPAHSDFYEDQTLHPNDLGFGIYTQNLYAELKKYL